MDLASVIAASRRRVAPPPPTVFDSASNYAAWGNGTNGGSGFGPWEFTVFEDPPTFYAGGFIGDPTPSFVSMVNPSFGMYANPEFYTAGAIIERNILQPLPVGRAFRFKWGFNFDSGSLGSKGFTVSSGGTEIAAVAVFDTSDVLFSAFQGSAVPAVTTYGTSPMTWTFARTTSNNIQVTATGRTNNAPVVFTTNISTGLTIDRFKLFINNQPSGEVRNQYFNDFEVFTI